jgi:hypothetical protein
MVRRNNFAFSVRPERRSLREHSYKRVFLFLGEETASVAACSILGMEFDIASQFLSMLQTMPLQVTLALLHLPVMQVPLVFL